MGERPNPFRRGGGLGAGGGPGERTYVRPDTIQKLEQTLKFIAERQAEQTQMAKATLKDTQMRQLPVNPKLATYKEINNKITDLLNRGQSRRLSPTEQYQLNKLVHKQNRQYKKLGAEVAPDSDEAPITRGYMKKLLLSLGGAGAEPPKKESKGTSTSSSTTPGRAKRLPTETTTKRTYTPVTKLWDEAEKESPFTPGETPKRASTTTSKTPSLSDWATKWFSGSEES